MILVLADTSLLTQSIVFSTDLVMIFFLLMALNSILYNKRIMLAVAIFGLLFSHMRGAMGMAMIGLFDLYKNKIGKNPFKSSRSFMPICPDLFCSLPIAFSIML